MKTPYRKQPGSFTLDGQRYRLNPLVPAAVIEWTVAKMHVGMTDSEVAMTFRQGAKEPGWTERLIVQAERYAVYCHRKNQSLYRFVMSGM
jgi:hypothetical protein